MESIIKGLVEGSSPPQKREVAVNASGHLITAAASAPAPPLATEPTLVQVRDALQARATQATALDAAQAGRDANTLAALQRLIDERKPYQLVPSVDFLSYVQGVVEKRSDGRVYIEIQAVFENGQQTGVADVNWGINDLQGQGSSYLYDGQDPGSHEVTVLGANGMAFVRRFNHRPAAGIDTQPQPVYWVEQQDGSVHARDYLRLTIADAAGAVLLATVDLDLQPYAPALPDDGSNKYRLIDRTRAVYAQPRHEEIGGGGTWVLPPKRAHSFAIVAEPSGADYTVYFNGVPQTYTSTLPMPPITAPGGLIEVEIVVQNNSGSKIKVLTLS